MADLRLVVELSGQHHDRIGVCIEIPEIMQREFEPLRSGDVKELMMIRGGDVCNEQRKIVIKQREDSAKILSEYIAKLILDEMSKNDTHDGYRG